MGRDIRLVKDQIYRLEEFREIVSRYEIQANELSRQSYYVYLWILQNQETVTFIDFADPELAYFSLLAKRLKLVDFQYRLENLNFARDESSILSSGETHPRSIDATERKFLLQKVQDLHRQMHLKKDDNFRKTIAICIPTFNRPDLLEKALENFCLLQRLPDELIVVDDGSSPENLLKNRTLASKFSSKLNLKFFTKIHEGPHRARNFAAQQSLMDILIFFDDDNIPNANMIENLSSPIEQGLGRIVTAPYIRTFTDPTKKKFYQDKQILWVPIGDCSDLGLVMNCYGDSNFAIERDVFLSLGGFDESFAGTCEDWEFFDRAVHHGEKIFINPTPSQIYLEHSGSYFKSQPRLLNELRILTSRSRWAKCTTTLDFELNKSQLSLASNSTLKLQVAPQDFKIDQNQLNETIFIEFLKDMKFASIKIWSLGPSELKIFQEPFHQSAPQTLKIERQFILLKMYVISKATRLMIKNESKNFIFVEVL